MNVHISPKAVQWAWLAVLVAALVSRLVGLGATPLAPMEASRAVAAWDAASGKGWPATSDSPLLLAGNVLLFVVLYPTAWLARLLPALAGIALVGLPFLWRRELGELGALSAAGLLLVSPLTLFAAQRVDGAALAVLGAGLLITAAFRTKALHVEGPGHTTTWVALGLALGLTGGPTFYDALIAGVLVWLLLRRLGEPRPPVASQTWRRGAVIGLGAALLISVAWGMRWSGWAGVLDGAAAWLGGWRTEADRGLGAMGLLALYEPALLALTVTGLGLLAVHRDGAVTFEAPQERRTPWALALLSGVVALLVGVRPGVSGETVSLVVLPLAMFGGWAVDCIWGGVDRSKRQWMGLHSLVAAVLWVPALLALAQNARGLINTDQILLILLGLIVLLALQILLVFIFVMQLPLALVWRGTLTGFVAILLLLQVSFAAGLAFVRSNQAIEPVIRTAGSRNMQHLVDMLQRLAIEREARRDNLPVVLLDRDSALTPTLRWTLRSFGNVTVTADWPEDPDVLVVAPEALDLSGTATDQSWQGMRFVAATTYTAPLPQCRLVPLACSEALRWYLYRESTHAATPQSVILWRVPGEGR